MRWKRSVYGSGTSRAHELRRSGERTRIRCGAEVVDLVDLEQRINFARAGQNIIDLISSNCIQTASEGVELDQIQVWLCLHIGSCLVEAGVVHPLVGDDQRTVNAS